MSELPTQPVQPVADERERAGDAVDAVLFTPAQLGVVALFGTPIAAGLLWFWNVRALGRRHAGLAFVAGALLTLVPFALGVAVDRALFGVAVVVCWPLGYGLCASLAFPPRAARPWALALVVAGVVAAVVVGAEAAFDVRGQVLPRPPVDVDTVVGGVVVVHDEASPDKDAAAVAAALADAGLGKDAPLRLRLRALPDREPELTVRVPRGGADVVDAGKGVAHVAAVGLGRCLRVRLLLPSDVEVASGRA